MRIDALTVFGFKSFGERVRLEFLGGINAVIGPNGSGKSNVVEAIRWVTHTARARELRAQNSAELIFHGSSGRSPLGMAEVELELSGVQAPELPARLNIARRVYRDGDSEQELLGRPVRARDVQAALRGSGLGVGGLAVIGQGEVSSVVSADTRTLAGYLEEAAGLSKLTHRRTQTLERLDEAHRHLESVRLIESELAARVVALEVEAAQARRHAELSARRALLESALAAHRQQGLKDEIARLTEQETRLSQASVACAAELQRTQAELETVRAALVAAGVQDAEYRRAAGLAEAARARLEAAESLCARLRADRARLEEELASLQVEPPRAERPDLAAQSAALREARARCADLEARATRSERALREAEAARAAAAQRQAAQDARAAARLAEQTRLQALIGEARQALEALEGRLAPLREGTATLEAELASKLQGFETARGEAARLRAEAARLEAAHAPLERERARLEAALNAYARYGEGPRNALRSGLPGIIGSVADTLSVPAEHEVAVTAALGRRLEQVVVEDAETARAVIAHLKRTGGRATFLPLDLIRPRIRRDAALQREHGVIGYASDLVPSDPAIISQHLLGDTLLVESDDVAVRLARRYAARPRMVSRAGEVLEASGALTGGRLRDAGVSVLAEQRRLQELEDELGRLEAALARARSDLEAAAARARDLEAALPDLRACHARAEADLRAAEREAAALQSRLETLTAQLAGSPPEQPADARAEAVTDPARLEAELTELRRQLEAARAAERDQQEAAASARAAQLLWERYDEARARADRVRSRLAALEADLARQSADLEAARAERDAREADLAAHARPEVAPLEARRGELETRYADLTAQLGTLRADLDHARLSRARREAALEALPEVEAVALEGEPRAWQAELARTERDLHALGPINNRAEADFLIESERLAALRRDLSDAQRSADELLEAVGGLERLVSEQLEAAYGRVRRAFHAHAAELCGNGDLEAVRSEDGRLVGLRLAVQPREKRTRSLHLLSAGERTMVGLAFLFSLAEAPEGGGGLPLAILDEVDAPLDEANIRRFAGFLKLLAGRGTQFILVTHQKATMEIADALWGVTTDARGVSRTFSIRAEEAAGLVG
ncbi:chromosome segregation protein [Deinobacterium chartae]|uniref:Chromosome partition protein Smc n=1 Tax=Deinobacterium chartae TaxID=521158 RepID=A0A841HTN8_9DEIO|nr:chromosome segregation SMC family protein [Deinobacterium chartae]MBB6096717.1 chromosome segregation protein [Deinobacterium chartae]